MKKALLILLISLPFFVAAQTQTFVATFAFDSVKNTTGRVDPTPHPVVTGLTFDSVTAVGSLSANSSASSRFSFTGWPNPAPGGNVPYSSFTGTVDTSKYYTIGIIPQTGYMVDIDSISFRFQRSGTGVRTYVVRGSEDNFATNLSAAISPANPKLTVESGNVFFMNYDSTSGQNGSMIYLDTAYASETDPVYFRFYGYNAEGGAGTFSIDNLTIYGTTSVIIGIRNANSSSITVYPNPAKDILTIAGTADSKDVVIYDIAGNAVLRTRSSAATMRIGVEGLSSGVYFMNIHTADGVTTKRFVKN